MPSARLMTPMNWRTSISPLSATSLKTAPTPTMLETCSRAWLVMKASPITSALVFTMNQVKSQPFASPSIGPVADGRALDLRRR